MNVGLNEGLSCVFTSASKKKILLLLTFELAAKKICNS